MFISLGPRLRVMDEQLSDSTFRGRNLQDSAKTATNEDNVYFRFLKSL